jgi:predicted TIM-barrel fold metal-dependent hydrolase
MWRCGSEENLSMCCLIDPEAVPTVDRKELCNLARHKRTTVKISAFYALSKGQPEYLDLAPVIRRLLDAYGPERLMWATDCPFQVQNGHTYVDSVALIRDRLDFLSDSDRQWLLGKTAKRVFFS